MVSLSYTHDYGPLSSGQATVGAQSGAVIITACFLFVAVISLVALSIDGFSLVSSHLIVHNSAEYAAEAGLRLYVRNCITCQPDCPSCPGSEEAACQRAQTVARHRLFAGALQSNINICGGSDGSFELGEWNAPNFNAGSSTKNAAKVQLQATQQNLFFARLWRNLGIDLQAIAIVHHNATANDGLYENRFVK